MLFDLAETIEPRICTIQVKRKPNQSIRRSWWNGIAVGILYTIASGTLIILYSSLGDNLTGGLSNLTDQVFEPLNNEIEANNQGALRTKLAIVLAIGMFHGFSFGAAAAIQHLILRIILTLNGSAPWHYQQFLEYAVGHRFIQRTGGRYRFIHDLLRKRFAQLTPQQQVALAQPSRSNP
ncbi:MAG: hypothetical protein HC800_21000 [Phormidesmis sp. RL_2_1]|nr:hypothetical protein [Phormidesmis sp. RL_2_1]